MLVARHDTGFHDHGASAGAVVVLGRRPCAAPALDSVVEDAIFAAGESFAFAAGEIHRVRDLGVLPATTLHVYSQRLHDTAGYALSEDGAVRARRVPAGEELRPVLT